MSRKQFAVCLLALAGSASFLAAKYGYRRVSPRSQAADAAQSPKPTQEGAIHGSAVPLAFARQAPAIVADAASALQAKKQAGNLSLPIAFEPNVRQTASRIRFVGRGKGATVFLTDDEILLRPGHNDTLGIRFVEARSSRAKARRGRAGGGIAWRGEQPLRGQSNYLIGNDSRKWSTGVPHFARVSSSELIPGVSGAVYGGEEGLEYDLRLAPGADASNLRLTLEGATNVRLSPEGDLLVTVGTEVVKMKKPRAYQKGPAAKHRSHRTHHGTLTPPRRRRKKSTDNRGKHVRRRPVDAAYVLEVDGSIGFRVGPHDAREALVIDPILSVAYASFLGGSGTDIASSVALDSSGKIYVSGTTTSSTSFPEGLGNRSGTDDGPSQFFVAKIDPTATGPNSLIYLTFLGGSGKQSGGLIAVDGSGNVAITGTTTSSDFPVTDTSQPTIGLTSGYGNDVIVSELDPTGSKLLFSTLFGGSGAESLDSAGGIALDSSGEVYIAADVSTTPANTNTPDLPVTNNAFQTVWDGEPSDGFFAIFTPPPQAGGTATLKYCSYLGTNAIGLPGVGGVAVDSSGNAYIAGFAANSVSGFPVKNALQTSYGGGTADGFLMKISPLGQGSQDVVYATELGGSEEDEALAVAVDSANPPNAYVTGVTESSDFPMKSAVAGFQTALHVNATSNAFLAVVSENPSTGQTSLAYATYLGGSSADSGQGIAVGSANAVYVTGNTTSFDFPWKDNLQPFNSAGEAFVAKLDATSPGAASLIFATPLAGTSPPGGTASASGNAIVTDGAGHSYVAGITTSGDFPTALSTNSGINGFQQDCTSCTTVGPASDAFVAEIAESSGQSPSVLFTLPHLNFSSGGSGPQFVGVLNSGESGLTISNISVTGPDAADFPITGQAACVGSTITPGIKAQCSFEIGFSPTMVGPEAAAVAVTDNAPGSPQVLELTGTGGAGPLAAVSPPSVSFGSQPENTASPSPAVAYLQNIGSQAMTLTSVGLGGTDVSQFTIDPGGANGFAGCQRQGLIPPGGTCVVQVSFTPTSQGSFHAELNFVDNSGNSTSAEQVVPISGAGVATAPIANVAPTSLAYGSLTVGGVSAAQTVTLTNNGSAALNVSAIGLTGANASEFAIQASGTTCPLASGSIAIKASCIVAVQFTPQDVGSMNASLSFTDNATGSPQQVALSATATAAVSVAVSPPNLMFGAQSEGTSSAAQIVNVSNMSSSSAGVGPVSLSGTNASDFTAENPCAPSLAAGKSCQIAVTFKPAAGPTPGSRSATLNVGGGSPSTVGLSGVATQASISVPPSANFSNQLAGTAGTPVPVVVKNNSSGAFAGALSVSSVSLSESGASTTDFSITADSCTGPATAPGGTCAIQVAFQPASLCPTLSGTRNATLTINDNAPGSPHTVTLAGSAVDFCVTIQPGQGPAQPIRAGQSETFNLEVQSSDPTAGSGQLTCAVQSGTPGGCTVSTTPATNPPVVQVMQTNPGLFQMVVNSNASASVLNDLSRLRGAPRWQVVDLATCLAVILMTVIAIRRWEQDRNYGRRTATSIASVAASVVLFAVAVCFAACGGNSATPDPLPAPPQSATYQVTATATITAGQSSVTRTFSESVTIQTP
ncbi:MAG TPA: choice-of-anchor D domain-containing protein [Candidatus Acidoferrales bacterium]|nr:choice-of-anchor D domain-containing protein [Candidatus Acidoferrales bacterium]